jgi:predicted secreted hydrolase
MDLFYMYFQFAHATEQHPPQGGNFPLNSTPIPLKAGIALVLLLVNVVSTQELSSTPPQSRRGFAQALAPREWKFPRDHGKHEEFQTEWWYYTGNLRSEEGRRFGYQLTFFRNALLPQAPPRQSRWAFRDGYVAHFTITDVERQRFFYDQRMARGALGLAAAANDSLAVHVGAWSAVGGSAAMRLQAQSRFGGIALDLSASRAPVLHGQNGFVRKGEQRGEASYYYSQPHLRTSGLLILDQDSLRVQGTSWMDHEFFSGVQQSEIAGWDWFSLHLSDSTAIMLYLIRLADGAISSFSAGTLIGARREAKMISFGAFEAKPVQWWRSEKTGAQYPIAWQLKVEGYDLRVTAAVARQELDTRLTTGVIYWEGCIEVSGTKGAQSIAGAGYLEMTGYAQRFDWSGGR